MPERQFHVDLPPKLVAMDTGDRKKAIASLRTQLVTTQPVQDAKGAPLRQSTTGFSESTAYRSEALVTFYSEQPQAQAVIEALGMRVFELIIAEMPRSLLEDREKQDAAVEGLCRQINERLRKSVAEDTPEEKIPHVATRIPETNRTVFHTKAYGEKTGAYVRNLYSKSKITVLGA